jgi:hypothetical protein
MVHEGVAVADDEIDDGDDDEIEGEGSVRVRGAEKAMT